MHSNIMSKTRATRVITQHLNSLEGHYSTDSADHFSPCTSSSSSSVCMRRDEHSDHHAYHFHPSSSRLHHKQCGKLNSHRTCDGPSENIHDSSCKVMMRAKDKQSYPSKTGTRSKHEHLMTTTGLLCVISLFLCRQLCEASWDQWWTYDGISGESNPPLMNLFPLFLLSLSLLCTSGHSIRITEEKRRGREYFSFSC